MFNKYSVSFQFSVVDEETNIRVKNVKSGGNFYSFTRFLLFLLCSVERRFYGKQRLHLGKFAGNKHPSCRGQRPVNLSQCELNALNVFSRMSKVSYNTA
jgi:hypothetical protein